MKLTIVIPTYNRAEMVVAAASSALEQSRPARVIVVDDGSTDGTSERVGDHFGDRVEVITQQNRERGAARNRGAAEAADADLLCFLDADDVLRPDHVEALLGAADRHPAAPILLAASTDVDETLEPVGSRRRAWHGPFGLMDFLTGALPVPVGASVVRSKNFFRLGGYSERRDLAGSEDWLLNARLLATGDGVGIEEETILLRKHGHNTMGDPSGMLSSMMAAHQVLFADDGADLMRSAVGAPLPVDLADRARVTLLLNAATAFYGVGDMARTRSLLRESLGTHVGASLRDSRFAWTWARSLLGAGATRRLREFKHRRRRRR